MTFFEQLSGLAEGLDITIRIKRKDELLSISILPEPSGKNGKIKPMVFTGTAQEFDEGFFGQITAPLSDIKLRFVNKEEFEKSVEDAEKKDEKTSDQTSKPAPTKPAAKKSQPKKTKAAPKKAAPKKSQPKKEVKKKPEKVPETSPIVSEPVQEPAAPKIEEPSLF